MVGLGVAAMRPSAAAAPPAPGHADGIASDRVSGATSVILASASAGRRSVLRAAGIDPVVLVSGIDEESVLADLADAPAPDRVTALAGAKADATVRAHADDPLLTDAVVIGGDSMLLLDGELQGKPHTPEVTRQRWAQQAGRTATLLTGHAVLRVRSGRVTARAARAAAATVRIGRPSDEELEAYIGTGEPLEVAGALTIDGLGGWFVDGIDGDPSCVVGLSLPVTRQLLREIGVTVTDLWTASTNP